MADADPDIKLDLRRASRIGLDEAIFCAGKSMDQLARILDRAASEGLPLLLTRLSLTQHATLGAGQRGRIDYDPLSGTGYLGDPHPLVRDRPSVAVVAAGTSDSAVGREAARTLRYYGEPVREITDVGVAGLWRLLERLHDIREMAVVIAVAGMDAALPTVLGGLVPGLVIGVPTSVGYGAARDGETALYAILSSCAPGITVVNIDNGYGAACAAIRALRAMAPSP